MSQLLNKPNISYNKEVPYTKPIRVGLQAGYEFDINPFERGLLPRFSYLYTFLNLVKYDEYVIYQENLSKTLLSEKYESRWKGKKIKTQDKKTYILKDKNTGYYKIGKSINPLDREKTLQAEKPTYELIKIFNNDIESDLHKKYKKQNVRGEWFNLNKIQLKYICTSYE